MSTRTAVAGVVGIIVAVVALSGCAMLEPTAKQKDSFSTRQQGYRLTAEELAAIPNLLEEVTKEEFDADGRLTSRTVAVVQRGYPTATKFTETRTSEAFADSTLGLEQDANSAGTRTRVDRSKTGNADTLALSTATQTDRTDILGAMAADLGGAVARGAVDALINAFAPMAINKEQQRTERRAIEANRDVELKKLEPVHHEAPAPAPAEPAGE
jgi:hypothetical protein